MMGGKTGPKRIYSDEERKQRRNVIRNKYHKSCRKCVIDHYGGKCACCGENHIEFLAIDHIHGDGNQDRKEKGGNTKLMFFLFREMKEGRDYKDQYQILCHNCNLSLGFYGYCPHNKE